LVSQLKGGGGGEPGHSNRIQCVKYDKEDQNLLVSGGWDKTVLVWDIRTGEAVKSIFGPYIGGESLDIHDGIILTGSFQSEK
jgi:COMPASS component SWD3